jgi:hypothetical protein
MNNKDEKKMKHVQTNSEETMWHSSIHVNGIWFPAVCNQQRSKGILHAIHWRKVCMFFHTGMLEKTQESDPLRDKRV